MWFLFALAGDFFVSILIESTPFKIDLEQNFENWKCLGTEKKLTFENWKLFGHIFETCKRLLLMHEKQHVFQKSKSKVGIKHIGLEEK